MSVKQLQDRHAGRRLAARDLVVLLVLGVRLLQTLLGVATGTLAAHVCEEYQCAASTKGWILSAYAFGYCGTQVIGGAWADRAGSRGVVGASLALAGLALAAAPVAAAAMGLWGVCAAQVLVGAASGPLLPATTRLLAQWLPPEDRALASTMLDAGVTLGSLVAIPTSGALAAGFGWRFALVMYGSTALAYSSLWSRCAAEGPQDCTFCGDEERALLELALPTRRPKVRFAAAVRFAEALQHAQLWAIYVAHFASNYSAYFISTWSASYYLEELGLRPEQAGLRLALPHAASLAAKVLLAPFLDRAMKAAGFSDLGCRRTFSGLGFAAPALCLVLLRHAGGSVRVTTALLTAALGFMGLHPSGFQANYMDVTCTHTGIVSGIGSTIASAAPSVAPLMVSHLRRAPGGWAPVLRSVAAANVLAALVYCTLSSTTLLEDAAPSSSPEVQVRRVTRTRTQRLLDFARRRAHGGSFPASKSKDPLLVSLKAAVDEVA